jgi:hypothetical protein
MKVFDIIYVISMDLVYGKETRATLILENGNLGKLMDLGFIYG